MSDTVMNRLYHEAPFFPKNVLKHGKITISINQKDLSVYEF